ncbi:MAG TPA: flagellar biosynthesis anti-sigma factor FlgM [Ktedonobacteraceae bacterium]|jgi:AcrR family transcriptional regulator|nr:flagellar biosynthesis anti-sigma factor FlgM [Ktedonobacteraceae bacterium]
MKKDITRALKTMQMSPVDQNSEPELPEEMQVLIALGLVAAQGGAYLLSGRPDCMSDELREAKVRRLRSQVAAGIFQPESETIARKMLGLDETGTSDERNA